MEKTNNNAVNPRRNIKINAGSTGLDCLIIAGTREEMRGIGLNQRSQSIGYDAQDVEHNLILPTVDQKFEHAQQLPNMINASIGDLISRQKLVNKGEWWMVNKDFAIAPRILDKHIGTGGNLLYGRALFAANKTTFTEKLESVFKNIFKLLVIGF